MARARTRPLAGILRELGVTPRRVRQLKRSASTHWLVYGHAPFERVVLREFHQQFGERSSLASFEWEICLLEQLHRRGWPVPRLLQPLQQVDDRWYGLFSAVGGRQLPAGEGGYRWLGKQLARLQQDLEWAMAAEPLLSTQRPGWGAFVRGYLPRAGGEAYRQRLLEHLAAHDPGFASQVRLRAAEVEQRVADLGLHEIPLVPVHSDFSPWNLRWRAGEVSALYDFDLSHLDVYLADLAFARRGYHDAVVYGYCEAASLSARELEALPVLWNCVLLYGLWEALELAEREGRLTNRDSPILEDLRWTREQFAKTRPFDQEIRER